MVLVRAWLRAFVLTLALELPVASWGIRVLPVSAGRRLAMVLFANLASHPAVWFIFPRLGLRYWPRLIASEVWAIGVELLFYWLVCAVPPPRSALTATAANLFSAAVGFWLLR